jgi:hypothetical protein
MYNLLDITFCILQTIKAELGAHQYLGIYPKNQLLNKSLLAGFQDGKISV